MMPLRAPLAVAFCALLMPLFALADSSPAMVEARRHFMDADVNAQTFQHTARIFETARVNKGGTVWRLAEAPQRLDFSYAFEGQQLPAEGFAARTFTNALLILKRDRIVYEKYFNGAGPDSHFLSMSVAKSVVSTLIGMAIADGLIGSIDDPLVKYLPELKGGGYDGVTIRQALLMRSGVDWDEIYDFDGSGELSRLFHASIVENRIRFVEPARKLRRTHPPGSVFNYSTLETAVLGWALERAVKQPLAEYMSRRWWQPAGMQSHAFWMLDGVPAVGRPLAGMGFNATARDYARFGLMMLHEGRANGRQLVPAAWVREATGADPATRRAGYQYQWWLSGSRAFMAMGLQGQYIYVNPDTATIVVKLGYSPLTDVRAGAEGLAFFAAVSAWQPATPEVYDRHPQGVPQ